MVSGNCDVINSFWVGKIGADHSSRKILTLFKKSLNLTNEDQNKQKSSLKKKQKKSYKILFE